MRATAVLLVLLIVPGSAQVTERISVTASGAQVAAGGDLHENSALSADGRFVAFQSLASDLVPNDTNGFHDIFLRDRWLGTVELVSVGTGGAAANGPSTFEGIAVTPDGRFVAFTSAASNLGPDANNAGDVFLRDRATGQTEVVSVSPSGTTGAGHSAYPALSDDGRHVAFASVASDLGAGDVNGTWDVFVRDRLLGTTDCVTCGGNGMSSRPRLSADGRFVAFESFAANLVPGDTNAASDVFVHDRLTSILRRVSVATGGAQAGAHSYEACLSADGRVVAFASIAGDLVPGDTNGDSDVFVHDRALGTTERVNVSAIGAQGGAGRAPSLSADGRFVAFVDRSPALVPRDTNGDGDVFVRDRVSGTIERVSVASSGLQADGESEFPSITRDGRYVAFRSRAGNLVVADTNSTWDVFVHDRDASGFAGLCEPGVAGTIQCPCGNPPVGPGRGCDNSSATGGASLSASGAAYLTQDSLVLVTRDQVDGATSIVLQGNLELPGGTVFGQGVRCAGGPLLRLYVASAVGGGIVAPNATGGDPSVSIRSAALGDPILAGESRLYLVHYRDPVVLGSCPPTATFNATQTGRILWSP